MYRRLVRRNERLSAIAALAALILCTRSAPVLAAPGHVPGPPQAVLQAANGQEVAQWARNLSPGQALRIERLRLESEDTDSAMDLERFEIASGDAVFVVHGADGSRNVWPELPVYLRGSLEGRPGSLVVLSVHASGAIRGLVSTSDGAAWVLHKNTRKGAGLHSSKLDAEAAAEMPTFACDALEAPSSLDADPSQNLSSSGSHELAPSSSQLTTSLEALPLSYTARIAVELDYDFYARFGDQNRAIQYAMDLLAFTGTIGTAELGMNVQVPFVHLWTVSSDPYSGSSSDRLSQLRNWWNSTNTSHCVDRACTTVARATTIMLSGANTGGGIAWISSLCGSYASPTSGYSYAFVGSINGNFSISSPRPMWDVIATAHELGHNFGSSHTHCYSPAVDGCYANEGGCFSGSTSLPSGCPGSGSGCGTIMSYCHLLTGSYGNISLTYGEGHPYGVAPERVPAAMSTYIARQQTSYPSCLAPAAVPGTPTNLVASAPSSSQINLSWVRNGSAESGFKIERRTAATSFVQIATVGAGVTSYTNTGLSSATAYTYRIRAYNSAGDSAYSNEASAVTKTAASTTSAACGQTLGGALTSSDAFSTVRTSSKADVYTFSGVAGQQLMVTMSSTSGLDPYVILKSPSGSEIARNNNTFGVNAVVSVALPTTGVYRIEATSYPASTNSAGLGSYTLALACADPLALACGQTRSGALAAGDLLSTVRKRSKSDFYTFAGSSGQQLRLAMNSTSLLDPFLVLKNPAGTVIAKNNNSGGLNSAIALTLPVTGTYRIEATAYYTATNVAGLGSYTIAATCP